MIQASLVAQTMKNPPAMRETWVRSLGWEDPLEEGMAPLKYFCLGNPMDRGAWRAAVHSVAKNQTWLSNSATRRHPSCSAGLGHVLWLPREVTPCNRDDVMYCISKLTVKICVDWMSCLNQLLIISQLNPIYLSSVHRILQHCKNMILYF